MKCSVLPTIALAIWVAPAVAAECTCDKCKLEGCWCDKCKVGHLAGVRIESELLFEVLDAHGHTIDPAAIQCDVCKEAIKSDEFCDKCRIGWLDKKAYMSRLTFHLAKGAAKERTAITCDNCKRVSAKGGWCDTCGHGMVGNVAIKDKADFAHALKAYRRLLKAVELSARCETCAVALMSDGECTKCGKRYRDGKLITDKQKNK